MQSVPSLFDIAPFSLPNCEPGEVRFEEPREITEVVVEFSGAAPPRVGLSYLQKTWPHVRVELWNDITDPLGFGWTRMDDWFNSQWQKAAVRTERESPSRVAITFRGTKEEFPDVADYNVAFRRTLGIRIDVRDASAITAVKVFTRSLPVRTRLRVELDAGRRTATRAIRFDGYNATVTGMAAGPGTKLSDGALTLSGGRRRAFALDVLHMKPLHRYSGDDAHVRFILDNDAFTVSLASMASEGPVWFAEKGVYVAVAADPTPFAEYRKASGERKTISDMVSAADEQTCLGAFRGQPRPHEVACALGCKHARQRYRVEAGGDVILIKHNLQIRGKDTDRFANEGDGRFFFGLEGWQLLAHWPDPAPAIANNMRCRRGPIEVEQQSFAVPLERSILKGEPAGDENIVCMMRLRFRNVGEAAAAVEFPISYSRQSHRGCTAPESPRERLAIRSGRIYGTWQGEPALRCMAHTSMTLRTADGRVVLSKRLAPGEICEAVLKIPYIALDSPGELTALDKLEYERCHEEMTRFWRHEVAKGARVHTPVPQLNELDTAHLAIIQISDIAMPDDPSLVNTSVGSSTYGNFSNEACMINQELDQRGMIDDVRRRLAVWVRYQGTVPQPGNFTDYDGMYYGAGGFECGHYNQHHGWVLWRLAEHFLYTRDRHWFAGIADSLIAGADWVFRQRRATMKHLPHSRGWERGFLPAGSLEDVTDFFYWLSTNALTWRGADVAARALEAYGHPEAARVRRGADAYGRDLRRGFDTMRQHSPLVRLRDGRWIPHYPSRIYCRGRDLGWIREVLEGSVYLLISGLYKSASPQGKWILDDFQDNRYVRPPYGYAMGNFRSEWFTRGGFSCQPNLLAGLMPHLERDEPEIFIWMFFNAWNSCYRQEINAMTEHPAPTLGFSNEANPKTSDQANAIMWLRYMFVFAEGGTLHVGRAIPRAWFGSCVAGEQIGAERVHTPFGTVSVAYQAAGADRLRAAVSLKLRRAAGAPSSPPERVLVRFRHPDRKQIASVKVNGKPHVKFDPETGDVDITGLDGKVTVEARYR